MDNPETDTDNLGEKTQYEDEPNKKTLNRKWKT
jgi:hypothetical protein